MSSPCEAPISSLTTTIISNVRKERKKFKKIELRVRNQTYMATGRADAVIKEPMILENIKESRTYIVYS
jgi:hypothetical protein